LLVRVFAAVGIKEVFVDRVELEELKYEIVGIPSFAGFLSSGLTDVDSNFHKYFMP
jgi:hypothetical protein